MTFKGLKKTHKITNVFGKGPMAQYEVTEYQYNENENKIDTSKVATYSGGSLIGKIHQPVWWDESILK